MFPAARSICRRATRYPDRDWATGGAKGRYITKGGRRAGGNEEHRIRVERGRESLPSPCTAVVVVVVVGHCPRHNLSPVDKLKLLEKEATGGNRPDAFILSEVTVGPSTRSATNQRDSSSALQYTPRTRRTGTRLEWTSYVRRHPHRRLPGPRDSRRVSHRPATAARKSFGRPQPPLVDAPLGSSEMAATMDDLIATMGRGALVGQEGYDLRALQVRGRRAHMLSRCPPS